MASLPSNSFMFNYNAKEYDAVTHTFPKTQGQLFNEDLVLNKAPSSYGDDYVYFGNSQAYTGRTTYSSYTSPFNRTSSNNNLTFIYKTSGWTSDNSTNLFANRHPGNRYNWFVRARYFFGKLDLIPSINPQIVVVRVNSDGSAIKRVVNSSGQTLQSTTDTMSWGNTASGFGFFAGYAEGNEWFNQTFYWMYCSLESLTDDEIIQVINYNEKLGTFYIEPDNLSFNYSGGTQSLTINSQGNWSASTNDSWITLSSNTGSGTTNISISVPENKNFTQRTGYVNVTDGIYNLVCTISQDKHPVLVPYNNLYINGNRVN